MQKNRRLFLMVAASSIASQIYVNMFVDGFIIALSVVVMGIFLYIFKDLNSVKACLLIGIFSPLVRLLIVLWQGESLLPAAKLVLPDMAFFFAYALIFGILFRTLGFSAYGRFYLRLAGSDFLSNCMEMLVRFMIFHQFFTPQRVIGLVTLAVIRSFLILLICIASDLYKSLLEKAEHEENYKKLVLMASTFNSEVYFMEKNMNEIEDVMKNAFLLYKTLERENYPKSLQHISLEIAKDIHEIKKGYRRVIMGLQDNFLSDFKDTSLHLSDILKILSVDVEKNGTLRNISIAFSCSFEVNYIIENHFPFMSILRNLVGNSVDAIEGSNLHRGEIEVRCREVTENSKKYCVITVHDNGPGIPPDIIDVLFEPGFSTKYDETTGDINRGLGLTLVRDLLSDKFHGEISVESTVAAIGQVCRGTTFTLRIPAEQFRVDPAKKSES
ncbi:MAG: ATP-binding protein [Anaerovoracaceae bacterium]